MADTDIKNVDIYDINIGEDILDVYGLQKIGVLAQGMFGEVLLVHRKVDPRQKFAVKKFSLLGDDREIKKTTRFFTREVGVMQVCGMLFIRFFFQFSIFLALFTQNGAHLSLRC